MKTSLYALISGLFISVVFVLSASALTGTSSVGTDLPEDNPLLVESIVIRDDGHIDIRFNQDIISESVRVRVAKQSDESNIRIASFTGGVDKKTINVILSDVLTPSTSYKMTIISAISEAGIIIKDGADGVKEFTTSEKLKSANIVLNAPTNPNSVMTTSGEPKTASGVNSGNEEKKDVRVSEIAKELPLSGMDASIFLVIAAALAFAFLIHRRRA